MVDAIQNTAAAEAAAPTRKPRSGQRDGAVGFEQMVDRTLATKVAPARTGHAAPAAAPQPPAPVRPRTSPEEASAALTQAMWLEDVPETWRKGLAFIMDKESRGQIDARNPIHSARGLFQLTRANYHLNPNGAASFGNGVEEAQGGIRYIQQRYGSADKAAAHWQRNGWY
jgi:hypothetical protein